MRVSVRYSGGEGGLTHIYAFVRNWRKRGIRTVTILDVHSKKSRSVFALVLKLEAAVCVCVRSSAFT